MKKRLPAGLPTEQAAQDRIKRLLDAVEVDNIRKAQRPGLRSVIPNAK